MSREGLPPDVPGESRFVTVDPADRPGASGDDTEDPIALHAVVAGPEDGDLVVLLHGFPEFWYAWHDQIRPLANEGFRVVVPDQRGYNRSDKPEGIGAYHVDALAGDVVGLVRALGHEEANVVGHDWGGWVAWWTALHHPEYVRRLVAVNAPHPSVMYRALGTDWGQRLRSSYVLGFVIPVIPERLASLGNWAPVVGGLKRSSNPGTFSPADLERYREAWSKPGAFRAMLHWYRAMARSRPRPESKRVTVPTRVVWGLGDRFLKRSMAHESVAHCDDATLCTIDGGTHWVHHEHPIRVADDVTDHLRGRVAPD